MNEKRNILLESARIARGKIETYFECEAYDYDGLVIPGGFGAAKNMSNYAFEGKNFALNADMYSIFERFF